MSLNNYIDFSTYSLVVGFVTFLIVFGIGYYLYTRSGDESDDSGEESSDKYPSQYVYVGIGVVGLVIALVAMILYKKYLEYRGTSDFSVDPFYT
jgi:hypothetical protein